LKVELKVSNSRFALTEEKYTGKYATVTDSEGAQTLKVDGEISWSSSGPRDKDQEFKFFLGAGTMDLKSEWAVNAW